MKQTITNTRLRELFDFESGTGRFIRLQSDRRGWIGREAGTRQRSGHISIAADGRVYLAHRLAWLYVHGSWPAGHIDHINGNPADNRIENLRDVDAFTNMQNRTKARKGNPTGLLGATPWGARFRAQICVKRKLIHIGVYATAAEAHTAYIEAKRRLHAGCTI